MPIYTKKQFTVLRYEKYIFYYSNMNLENRIHGVTGTTPVGWSGEWSDATMANAGAIYAIH